MTSIPDLSQLDPNQKPLIARPDLRPGVLLPPVVPPPPSTQGIASNQTMPDPPAATVAPPTMSPAQSRVDFLRESPSGVNQLHPKSLIGKIGKGALQGLDALGSTFAPGIAANIPGTTMHHNLLEAQAERHLGADVANQEKQATTREANAKADAENAPMPEKWDLVPGWQGPNGEPMEREETSGQFRVAQGVPGAKPIQKEAAMKPPHVAYDNGIPVSVTGQDGRVFDVNDPNLPPELKPLVEAANRAHQQRITEQNTAEDKRAKNAQDSQNRVFSHQEQLERDRENHGEQQTQQRQEAQTQAANKKESTSIQGALDFADNYLKDPKNWSGSGDDALQFQYFELARPQTGFRMNSAEIQRQNQARSWKEGLEARARHAAFGTWFSPEQRKQIVQSMHELAEAKLKAMQHGGGQQQGNNNDPMNIR